MWRYRNRRHLFIFPIRPTSVTAQICGRGANIEHFDRLMPAPDSFSVTGPDGTSTSAGASFFIGGFCFPTTFQKLSMDILYSQTFYSGHKNSAITTLDTSAACLLFRGKFRSDSRSGSGTRFPWDAATSPGRRQTTSPFPPFRKQVFEGCHIPQFQTPMSLTY
jgi:hypothetical protein